MNKFMIIFMIIFSISIVGCTAPGRVTEESINECYECRNRIDGEIFYYSAKDMFDIQVGYFGAPTTVKIKDSTGKVRSMSSDDNSYWDCRVVTCNK